MPISIAPLLLAGTRSAIILIRIERDYIFPSEDLQGHRWANIFHRVFNLYFCDRSILCGRVEGQWPHDAMFNLYPGALSNNETIVSGISCTLSSISRFLGRPSLPKSESGGRDEQKNGTNPQNQLVLVVGVGLILGGCVLVAKILNKV